MGTRDSTAVQRLASSPAKTESVADHIRRDSGDAVRRRSRHRMTVDLRGIGPALHEQAAARGTSVAAMVRTAVVAMLDSPGRPIALESSPKPIDSRVVKVTLRVGALHAASLADRARSAEVSQGTYVAALLDQIAASPRPTDHGDAIAALADSTQKVAAMSADIHAFIRLIRNVNSDEAQKYRAVLMSLSQDMRLHLQVASRLMARMTSRTRDVSNSP
jgi:hypothetical protein